MAQIRLNVSAPGGLSADAEALRALHTTIASDLAKVADDDGDAAVRSAATAIRGTLSMSNNSQASTLDTLAIQRPGETHAETEIVAVPRGAWHLVEYGARAHTIKPRRRSGRRAMPTTYGVFSRVHHPGTIGTGVWSQAMEQAEPVIDTAIQAAADAVAPFEGGS